MKKLNFKQKLVIKILSLLFGMGLPYIFFSVAYWDLNPGSWHGFWRIVSLVVGLMFSTLVLKESIKSSTKSLNQDETSTDSKSK